MYMAQCQYEEPQEEESQETTGLGTNPNLGFHRLLRERL
jgi:hypothetical protein